MRKCLFGAMAVAATLLSGCSSSETPLDMAKFETPVNQATIATMRIDPRDVAADALGRIGLPAVPQLSLALSDPNATVRMDACHALAYMGAKAKDAVPPLKKALGDQEEAVRQAAAQALGQIGAAAEPAIPELMLMMQGKKSG